MSRIISKVQTIHHFNNNHTIVYDQSNTLTRFLCFYLKICTSKITKGDLDITLITREVVCSILQIHIFIAPSEHFFQEVGSIKLCDWVIWSNQDQGR